MKVIIAGPRTFGVVDPITQELVNPDDLVLLARAVDASRFKIDEVVSGRAKGTDRLGEMLAKLRQIPVQPFPADWDGLGKKAGLIRNEQMANYADALVAIWDGKSHGTRDMIRRAIQRGLPTLVYRLDTRVFERANCDSIRLPF